MHISTVELSEPFDLIDLLPPSERAPFVWRMDATFVWMTAVEGSAGEMADFLDAHSHLVTVRGSSEPDVLQKLVERLRASSDLRVGVWSLQEDDPDAEPCELGCGDGLGSMDIVFDVFTGGWDFSMRYGCYSGESEQDASLPEVVAILEELRDRFKLAGSSLLPMVEEALRKLPASA